MELSQPSQLRKRPSVQFNNNNSDASAGQQQLYHHQSSSPPRYSSPSKSTSSLADEPSPPSKRSLSLSPKSTTATLQHQQQPILMKSLSNESSLNNMSSSSPSSQSPRTLKSKRRKKILRRRRFSLSSFLCNCVQSMSERIRRCCNNSSSMQNSKAKKRNFRHYQQTILIFYKRYIHPHIIIPTLQFLQRILSKTRQLSLCQVTCIFLFLISITATHVYFIDMPQWEYEREWLEWEEGMQLSVADLIPPPPPLPSKSSLLGDGVLLLDKELKSNKIQYGNKKWNDAATSEFVVPLPDYELMATIRGQLAKTLQEHAVESCNEHQASLTQQQQQQQRHSLPSEQKQHHSLPVMGITVATDSPTNNYLRRLLYTIDFNAVGSIVITWYDEQTESQLGGNEGDRLSHTVILNALEEFIVQKKFVEIPWNRTDTAGNGGSSSSTQQQQQLHWVKLANVSSMKAMSKIATSVHQYCRYNGGDAHPNTDDQSSSCENELIILRFSTNLGCSSGVNNPLFLHPHAPHWLIVNYDIAYPPGVLNAMGSELQKTLHAKPDLAVHTFGYIYGRGKIENPWSNFVMTSCAVAKAGIWDENIFPAYYEDDDFRDRIRYIMGQWVDVIGHDNVDTRNIPHKWMNDTHLIRYQTDRSVAVAHGPLSATTYLSGTHEALKEPEEGESYLQRDMDWLFAAKVKKQRQKDPYYYEKERWNIYKEVADGERYFQCKHGALPDPGEHGEDSLRYFGWHERFIQPFVNRTRLTELQERVAGKPAEVGRDAVSDGPLPWSLWSFNATRRKCVHEATNKLLAMPPSEEKTETILKLRESCSVC